MRHTTLYIVSAIIAIAGIVLILNCITNHERSECYQWQADAREYPGFYLANWQQAHCDFLKIKVK